jgi:hypothetical protein
MTRFITCRNEHHAAKIFSHRQQCEVVAPLAHIAPQEGVLGPSDSANRAY